MVYVSLTLGQYEFLIEIVERLVDLAEKVLTTWSAPIVKTNAGRGEDSLPFLKSKHENTIAKLRVGQLQKNDVTSYADSPLVKAEVW